MLAYLIISTLKINIKFNIKYMYTVKTVKLVHKMILGKRFKLKINLLIHDFMELTITSLQINTI